MTPTPENKKEKNMDELTERMKTCLVTIETDAVAALRDQPDDADENRRHLNKALALIELRAYTARRGDVAPIPAGIIAEITKHYMHAKTKHAYFCDRITGVDENNARENLTDARKDLEWGIANADVTWHDVHLCEVCEIEEAIARNDKEAAIAECFDAVAVLLRLVDVLQGRQELGDPAKAKGGEA
jgi:hypothetical protein